MCGTTCVTCGQIRIANENMCGTKCVTCGQKKVANGNMCGITCVPRGQIRVTNGNMCRTTCVTSDNSKWQQTFLKKQTRDFLYKNQIEEENFKTENIGRVEK